MIDKISNTVPLILKNNADILDVFMMNKKAIEKTTETNFLWILHPATHKVVAHVPEVEISVVKNRSRGNHPWVEAHTLLSKNTYSHLQKNQKTIYNNSVKQESTMQQTVPQETTAEASNSELSYSFLEKLYSILLQRKTVMPDGSYSSYLFSKGEEKIKKKLGEEAIELILAKDENELCNEAADLLYHVWIYFIEKNISPLSIIEVLHNRLHYS